MNKHWLPKIHFTPQKGLINDPNGLIKIGEKYYIFFQWNPDSCEHKNKHWGLTITSDWINYSSPELILYPEEWYNQNGCYSGCALAINNRIELFYTGNVRSGQLRNSYQIQTTFDPITNTTVNPQVIIAEPPTGYTTHFRDPKAFSYKNNNYLVIGSQSDAKQATVLLFQQTKSAGWQLNNSVKLNLPHPAYMFECPDIISLTSDKWFLLGSPQGMPREKYRLQNRYHCGYLSLNTSPDETELSAQDFHEFDYGFEFYAAQSFKTDNNSYILLGWLGMPEEEQFHPSRMDNWLYTLSLPRRLTWENNCLTQRLEINLPQYYKQQPLIWNTQTEYSYAATCHHFYLQLLVDCRQSQNFSISWYCGNNHDESRLKIEGDILIWERSSSLAAQLNGIRQVKLPSLQQIEIEIIQDGAVCEIWVNRGLIVLSGYLYMPEENVQLRIQRKILQETQLSYYTLD